jgi:myo-inositol-1(or 4)-monophosphatase
MNTASADSIPPPPHDDAAAAWLPDVLALAHEASALALQRFGEARAWIEKGVGDWASDADLEVEALLRRGLHAIAPASLVVGEEAGRSDGPSAGRTDRGSRRHVWHVDPIDGSANFVRGIPHFATVISLSERVGDTEDRVILGVTMDPCRQECFSALADQPTSLNGVPVRVSPILDPARALLSVVTPKPGAAHGSLFTEAMGRWMSGFGGIRRSGAMAIDLAWVACGRMDAFAGMQLAPWDVKAGILQVRQAGGTSLLTSVPRTIPDAGAFVWCLVANSQSLLTTLTGDLHDPSSPL